MKQLIKKLLREGIESNELLRDELISMGRGVCKTNGFLNCQLFTQLVSNTSEILKLPQVNNMNIGDILVWGRHDNHPPRHYSIYIGNNEVMEVEGWGEPMRIVSLDEVSDYYDGMLEIFRPNLKK